VSSARVHIARITRLVTLAAGAAFIAAGSVAAQTGSEAAARSRLEALVGAVNDGSAPVLQRFVREAFALPFQEAIGTNSIVGRLAGLHARSQRLTLQGSVATSDREARVALHNALTGEMDSLLVVVEPQAPHRIIGLNPRSGAGGVAAREVAPSDDAEMAGRLTAFIARLAAADAFSGVVLLARDGEPLVFEAHGMADRNHQVPVRRDSKFNLGSMNKTFTASIIGQLVEEGKIRWDDPLSRFLPDFPDSASAARVQIRHLLSHTAGLGSYFNQRYMESSRLRWRTVDDYMELARPDSLRFEPGTRYSYSNTGYLVLGKVIEVVTGQPYHEAVAARIYGRAGMTASNTFDVDQVVPGLAVSYSRLVTDSGLTWRNTLFEHVIRGGPAGGGFSTASDLLQYAEALRAGKIVSRRTLELMRTPRTDLGAERYGYGYVISAGPAYPRYWGHGGDFEGVDADLMLFGDSGYVLIVLANEEMTNPSIIRLVQRMLAARGIS
jgi:CubicO group peptidase (beta-lactamase class C family)